MPESSHASAHGHPPIRLPLQLRTLNAMGPLLSRLGLLNLRPGADHYMELARRSTGLSDFGSYDVRTAVDKMLHMLCNEADLHLFGRIASTQLTLRNLENCLRVQQAFVDEPELDDIPVEEPIIIVCTPRTGSTLLHNLLAQHPNVRAPRMWELHRPCPPPHPALEKTDARIRKSDREFGMYYRLIPEMRAIHYFAPLAVEECTHLFLNTFTCRMSFAAMANLTSYADWVMKLDMAPAYREYKRTLKILARNYPRKTLVLKSPGHLLCMEALHEVFPKARIVHIHRDPATAAGSFCSLTEAVQISVRRNVDVAEIGNTWNRLWTPAVMDSIRWRETGELNILDLDFRDVIADPPGVAASVFEYFGIDAPAALHTNIARYLGENPKDMYGSHQYDLHRYGLDRRALLEQYAPYIDFFDVALDAGA